MFLTHMTAFPGASYTSSHQAKASKFKRPHRNTKKPFERKICNNYVWLLFYLIKVGILNNR